MFSADKIEVAVEHMEDTGKKEDSYSVLVPKTPKAQEYHERYYHPRASKVLDEINSQPMTVFVCGPSEVSNPLTVKKIR